MLVQFYFAWVEPGDSTWDPAFARRDFTPLAFTFEQNEGDFATLTVEVRNERGVGLLAPTRKQWLWYSYDLGDTGGVIPRAFLRLVGLPTDILGETVTLVFIARPSDYDTQKTALADTLRVLPFYDELFIAPESRTDDDLVLEGYSRVWHIDPVTHAVTTSDELLGEDGIEEFAAETAFYEGLEFGLNSVPLTAVSVTADMEWTQKGRGTVDIFDAVTEGWTTDGIVKSYTMDIGSWPKQGTSMGEGWEVYTSSIVNLYSHEVRTSTANWTFVIQHTDGEKTTTTYNASHEYLLGSKPDTLTSGAITTFVTQGGTLGSFSTMPEGSFTFFSIRTNVSSHRRWQREDRGLSTVALSESISYTTSVVAPHVFKPTSLVVIYDAERGQKEKISFTLRADVQPILTDPGEEQLLRIDNQRTVNLSEPYEDSSAGDIPIGDVRRRSYIVTERGLQSLEYLIALARAHLISRSRAVEITIPTTLGRMPDISLRKNARIYDPRIPGGQALGKILHYSESVTGDTGIVDCKLKIGCAIGKGGTVTSVGGTPTYAEEDVMGPDAQVFTGAVVPVFDFSVGYTPPAFNPADDGLDLISGFLSTQVLEQPPEVTWSFDEQRAYLETALEPWQDMRVPALLTSSVLVHDEDGDRESETITTLPAGQTNSQEAIAARADGVNAVLAQVETVVKLKLKPMRGASFESPYEISITDLKLPAMINLEAVSG